MRRSNAIRVLALAAAITLITFAGTRTAGQAPAAGNRVVALRGATLLTVTNGTIADGTIVLRDGRIVALGAKVEIPAGAEVIDVAGRFVTPGLVDAHSHIAADAINEGGTTVSSMTGMQDVLDPTDVNIYRDLAGGLTTANVLHGSANPIGGKNAVIKLRWGKTRASDLLFEGAMPGIKFALGENPKDMLTGPSQGPRRYPATRMGVEFVIRDAFTRAKAYQKSWQDYERQRAAGQAAVPPRRDLQLEPLVEILEGTRLVHAHCYRADEILMLLRLAEEIGFRIATFQHVLEGYKVAREIAAHGAGASTFSDWWGYKIEAVDAIPHNAAIMTRKGVLVSINSDSAEHARRLNTEAAKSIKWGGLSDDEALAMVTINPAKQLRIDSRVGSLEVGKDADVVVWNRHPLSTYAIVDRTYIDGTLYYDRLAEQQRLTEIAREKSTLSTAERGSRTPPTADPDPRNGGEEPDGNGGPRVSDAAPRTADAEENATSAAGRPQTSPPIAPAGVLAVTNATIHAVSGPAIENGTIVMRDGRIEAVGAAVPIPADAKVIDAAGAHVYPGFINARTTVGLNEPGPRGFEDVNEIVDLSPHLRTRVAYHAESDAIPVARANGITTVAVAPTAGTFGGEVAVMNLDGWTWEEATLRPNAGIAFTFPVVGGGGRGGRGGRGGPAPDRAYEDLERERARKLDELASLFERARAYARAGPERTMDWTLEALVPVVEGRLPLITTANRADEIRDAVAFAGRVNVRLVISGGMEAAAVAPLLRENRIPVILGNVLSLPQSEDVSHAATYQLAGELAQAGVKVAFSTADSTNVRLLPYLAAISVAWGMDRDQAIRALTIDAAEILGIGSRAGTLERGKDANLFVAKGDPLEIRTVVTHVVIGGREVGVANRQEALFEKYMSRP
ncbi:MAG TPA: amidohydrolase family protein [Vicinamibacterales bacterium]|nr:amidohydrolase family protein [Vicinamibacterales bacterium]